MTKSNWIKIPVCLFIICLALPRIADAQINTEKYRKYYTDEKGFMFNAFTAIALKAGNTEYTALRGTARVDLNGKKFDTFLVGDFEYKTSSEQKIENQGFVHLRGMWYVHERTSWDFFLQRQYDEFIDLNSRNLAGTAIKYNMVDYISPRDSNNTLDIYVSIGLMYEFEDYELENGNTTQFLWRSTNFLSIDWLIKERLNLFGVIYYQPAFMNFSDFRITADTGVEFAIAKSLYFIFKFTYRYNNLPITNVKPYDLSIENGIRFEIK